MADSETIQSKLQQEVFQAVRRIPGARARYNCNRFEIEKDIVFTHLGDRALPREIVLEVNGLYHYPRNSEEPLGRDCLKHKALRQLGYDTCRVPYFDWAILPDSARVSYV